MITIITGFRRLVLWVRITSRIANTRVHPRFFGGSVLLIWGGGGFLLYVFTFFVPCCDVRYDFRITRCSVRLYFQLLVRGHISYVCFLRLFACSTHIVLCFCFVFLRLVTSFSGLSILHCPLGIL